MSSNDGESAPPPGVRRSDAYATTQPGRTNPDTLVEEGAPDDALELPEPGYRFGELIGRGGMGEVVSARDLRIGREVAIKRMKSTKPSSGAIARFLREARIQARLDHPAIVPVHELGTDADGRPYFTMKRLAGVTLADRVAARGALQPLLRAFVEVCLAVEFAHSRGVIHRDLKPSNIMLGDYGEVYVLDWGVARVQTDARRPPSEPGTEIDTLEEGTRTGDLLGTPGYMAPEQVRGEAIGPAVDVYALGAILFELLAGEPLHPRGTAALASTLGAAQQAPARRTPDRNIAPELDAACHAALAGDPAARPSARELGERIQRYLDGDRDVEHRRALAAEQLAVASAAFASGDPEARATAMHAAGRALALDPESTEAAKLVSSIILAPPRELPAALVEALDDADRTIGTNRMRMALFSMLSVLSFLVVLPWVHVKSWVNLVGFYGVIGATVGAFWVAYRRRSPSAALNLIGTFAFALAITRLIGPFICTPVLLVGCGLAITANPWLNARPLVVAAWLVAVTGAPLVLEWVGLFSHTWKMTPEGVISGSAILRGGGLGDAVAIIGANFVLLAAVIAFANRVNRQNREARQQNQIQAWHLGQLLPAGRASVR